MVNLKDENMPVNRKVLEKLPMSFTSFAVITGSVFYNCYNSPGIKHA